MNDPRVPKQKNRLLIELNAELLNLRKSCELWEAGYYEQSTTIAKTLRVLLYDYNKQKASLFGQLGLKSQDFFSTPLQLRMPGRLPTKALADKRIYAALKPDAPASTAVMRWEPYYFYLGRRDDFSSHQDRALWHASSFDTWWNEPVLSNAEAAISRGELVNNILSNELGGAHSAQFVTVKAAALLNGSFDYPGITSFSIGAAKPMIIENKVYDAVIRQIAYEVQRTIQQHYSDMVDGPIVVPPCPPKWRAYESAVRIRAVQEDLGRVHAEFTAAGEADTIDALRVAAEMYWHNYILDMQKRGL